MYVKLLVGFFSIGVPIIVASNVKIMGQLHSFLMTRKV